MTNIRRSISSLTHVLLWRVPLSILYPALIFNGPLFGPYKDFNLLNADFQFRAEPPLDVAAKPGVGAAAVLLSRAMG